jgi:hypothetical protein
MSLARRDVLLQAARGQQAERDGCGVDDCRAVGVRRRQQAVGELGVEQGEVGVVEYDVQIDLGDLTTHRVQWIATRADELALTLVAQAAIPNMSPSGEVPKDTADISSPVLPSA